MSCGIGVSAPGLSRIIFSYNVTASIKPGITVNCDIKTIDITNVLTIQLDLLSTDKDGNYFVYVLSQDKKTMSKKKIELGQ
jgi:multidrug efflux pump subunit AcrA (membrane-fusion protein)